MNLDFTEAEVDAVRDIIARLPTPHPGKISDTDLEMSLLACHLNGCPLDFEKLKTAPLDTCGHDVYGINRFVSRSTGKLGGCFHPRCAKKEDRDE